MPSKKVMVSIFLLASIVCIIVVYQSRITFYPQPSIPRWALVGSVSHKTLYIIFYPYQNMMIPLRNWDTLYTNDITIYAITFSESSHADIQLCFYQLENNTRWINIQKVNYTMPLTRNSFTKIEITLPTHEEQYNAMILADGKPILTFYHHSHPFYVYAPKKYTFGDLMTERLIYIFSSLIVCFLALGLSHRTAEKMKVIPQINVWGAIYVGTLIIAVIVYSTYQLIYFFGIVNVLWSYPLIFIFAFIFGFFLTKQPRRILYLEKPLDSQMPSVILKALHVVNVDNDLYVADVSLKDWINQRFRKVEFKGNPKWKVMIKNSENYKVYYKSLEFKEDRLTIEVEDIHLWDLEKYKAKIKTVRKITKEKDRLNKRLNELEASFEVETDRKARRIFKAYQKIRAETLTFEEKPKEELVEEIKNE